MASVYDFKGAFQRLLRPIAGNLIDRGVSANQVTGAGLIVAALVGLCIYVASLTLRGLLLLVPILLLVRMGLNPGRLVRFLISAGGEAWGRRFASPATRNRWHALFWVVFYGWFWGRQSLTR